MVDHVSRVQAAVAALNDEIRLAANAGGGRQAVITTVTVTTSQQGYSVVAASFS